MNKTNWLHAGSSELKDIVREFLFYMLACNYATDILIVVI